MKIEDLISPEGSGKGMPPQRGEDCRRLFRYVNTGLKGQNHNFQHHHDDPKTHVYRWKPKTNGSVLLKWLFHCTETTKCVWL